MCNFQFLTMFNVILGARAIGAGAASSYSSGSAQMMRLLKSASATLHETAMITLEIYWQMSQ
jgi:hypothetical protein